MKGLRHAVTKINTAEVQKTPFGTKATIFWNLAKMFMTFPHGIFPIWGRRFSLKVLIRYLTYTYFGEEISKIYILGENLNECFSSESRNRNTKMSSYQ